MDYITTEQYAEMHNLNIEAVRGRCKRGQMPHIKVGGRIMIRRDTPWEFRPLGRPRNDSRKSAAKTNEFEVKITGAYNIDVIDKSGKVVASSLTFLPVDEAVKIGERMKSEVEARG